MSPPHTPPPGNLPLTRLMDQLMTTPGNCPPCSPDDDRATAVVLVGHGTRDSAGVAEMRECGARLAAAWPTVEVLTTFLEFAEPTVAAGIDELAARGHRRLVVVPVLLFAAGHAQRDIPELIAAARARWPGLQLTQAPHLGCHPDLIELSARRFAESVAATGPKLASTEPTSLVAAVTRAAHEGLAVDAAQGADTLLVMIGRGSYEPSANAEMARFARLRCERTPLGGLELGFTAMAEPSLTTACDLATRLPFAQVVVQPHLLFAGALVERVRDEAARAAARAPHQAWRVAPALGVDPLLLRALADRAGLLGPEPAAASTGNGTASARGTSQGSESLTANEGFCEAGKPGEVGSRTT